MLSVPTCVLSKKLSFKQSVSFERTGEIININLLQFLIDMQMMTCDVYNVQTVFVNLRLGSQRIALATIFYAMTFSFINCVRRNVQNCYSSSLNKLKI